MSHEQTLTEADISRIVEMAWEDRTPFEAIEHQFGLTEAQAIKVMQRHMQPRSFRLWRARVSGRKTKHLLHRSDDVIRGYAPAQYKLNHGRK